MCEIRYTLKQIILFGNFWKFFHVNFIKFYTRELNLLHIFQSDFYVVYVSFGCDLDLQPARTDL